MRRVGIGALVALAALTLAGCAGSSAAGTHGAARRAAPPTRAVAAAPVVAGSGATVDPVPLTAKTCLARTVPPVTVLPSVVPAQTRVDAPPDDATVDARGTTFSGDGTVDASSGQAEIYPMLFGKQHPASGLCVIGGTVPGQLAASMTWPQLKAEQPQPNGRKIYFDAAALTEFARGAAGHLVDGLRVDNVSDGVAARGSSATTGALPPDGGNFYLQDAYFTNVHDDCVDVNDLISGIVYDSLLDGCYTGISERPDRESPLLGHRAAPGDQLVLDHVLLRMQSFPGPHPTNRCPRGTPAGYNQIFKWSAGANDLVVRHAVFLLDAPPCSTSYFPFPSRSHLEDVTIVWTGAGPWRWARPRGVRVTADRSVWTAARATWLRRHGCPDTADAVAATANACTRLLAPT